MTAPMHDPEMLDPLLVTFGQRLRTARAARGLTLKELGVRAGMQTGHVGRLESGSHNPTLLVVHRLAAACDVPASWFFETGEVVPRGSAR